MFIRYRTEGIFLSSYDRKEADRYLTVFTKDFGKTGVMGKSIRKIDSKLSSASRVFCHSEIEFVRGRYYNILTDSQAINTFPSLRKDLSKLSLGYKMADLVESFLGREEKEERVWLFLKKSFYLLEEYSFPEEEKSEGLRNFYYYFSFKLFQLLGYGPKVDGCVIDGKSQPAGFSPRQGGLICENCFKTIGDPLKVEVTEKDCRFLTTVFNSDLEGFLEKNPSQDNLGELLKNYLSALPSLS